MLASFTPHLLNRTPHRLFLTHPCTMNGDARQSRRVELILQQLEELPTLDAVAVRLLHLTTDEGASAEEVIELVGSDPALASKVLRLSRVTDQGRGGSITTIERAVLHLGFEAVRNAVLSLQIFDYFDPAARANDETNSETPLFDREAFWHHSLAVAVVTERLIRASKPKLNVSESEGFLAGLLHDLGILALHVLLPRSFDRVCQLAESHAVSIDHACSRVIGLTTKTAGKRLAERWQLPRSLGDVLWLHGQRFNSLPDLPHRPMIALVTLADMIAREHYTTPPGHAYRGESYTELAGLLGFGRQTIKHIIEKLPGEAAGRADALGMTEQPEQGLMFRSITRANHALGRINRTMRQRAEQSQRQGRALQTIVKFHESQAPGDSVFTVLEKVVRSAQSYFGDGFFAILYQSRQDEPWQLLQFPGEDREMRSELIDPPPSSTAIADLADNMQISMQVSSLLPWLSDYLIDARDVREVRLLPLRCGWGVSAVLLHDHPIASAGSPQQLEALSRTWAAAIAAGGQHEGARALGEQLAEANRMLIETQDELTQQQTMAALGELAAGAAHEMNNPLTIISGRSQQLVEQVQDEMHRHAAAQIVSQAHRLSDMITALRIFAEPVTPNRHATDIRELLVHISRSFKPTSRHPFDISTVVCDEVSEAWLDPEQIGYALTELVRNAVESKGSQQIELRVQTDPVDGRLKLQVRDDGSGFSEHALHHAFDPFFSEKSAGRQPGLGLSRARRLVEAHGGRITLENGSNGGAVATIWIDDWRREQHEQRRAA